MLFQTSIYIEIILTDHFFISLGSLLHQGVDSSLHLLFLIPVIMGIVPTTVWLIYIKLRKNKLDATSQASSSNNATVRNVERNSSWQNSNSERKVKYHVVKELVT